MKLVLLTLPLLVGFTSFAYSQKPNDIIVKRKLLMWDSGNSRYTVGCSMYLPSNQDSVLGFTFVLDTIDGIDTSWYADAREAARAGRQNGDSLIQSVPPQPNIV